MVMEAPPTPQCVGREFVRQYYTLLNQAPVHLHRFYSDNSMFIHGGLDVPNRETKQVIGQTQIHEHIQQLNFRDCHAKISQVDAQATLGNGVVVQVSGELSNGGQPMRRFTQTFVLAAETPKKYYVHNDIFRYQDMLITDEEIDQADLSRSDGEDDQEESVEINQNGQPVYYNNSASPEVNGAHVHEQDHQFPPPPNVTQPVMDVIQSTTQPTTYSAPVPPPTTQFPTVKQVEESVKPIETTAPSPPKEDQTTAAWSETYDAPDNTVEEPAAVSEPSPPTYEPAEPPVVVSNEPKTYANLLKSGSNMMSSHVDNSYHQHKPPISPPPSCTVPKPSELNSSRDLNRTSLPHPQNARGGRPGPSTPRGGSNMRGMSRDRPLQQSQPRASFSEDNDNDRLVFASRHSTGGGNFNRENGSLTSDGGVVFNDNLQLFMGNIPIEATDDELRLLFGRFGTILQLTVFRKQNQKGPNKVPVPFFGFVVFEDPNTIQKVLQRRPIYFPDNNPKNPASIKLNVEEKKKRGNSLSAMDSSDRMRRDDNRSRGGPPSRGGRGGSRGGGGGGGGGANAGGGMFNRGGDSREGGGQRGGANSGGLRNSTSNSFNKNR